MSVPHSSGPSDRKSVAVLGAGATGLAAAHRLVSRGFRVRVFESEERCGGSIRTETSDGWLVECGPNSLLEGDPAVSALIDELGLQPERVEADPAAKNRYIVRGGRAVAAPVSPLSLVFSPLFSFGAKLRLFRDLLAKPKERPADVSLASFIAEHFGRELVDYGLNPFVGGVYAGDPEKLSARHSFPQLWELDREHGSIIRGQIASAKSKRAAGAPRRRSRIVSFRHGLEVLPRALAARLPEGTLSCRSRVEALESGTRWVVTWRDPLDDKGESRSDRFDFVIAALPAPALAAIRFGGGRRPFGGLEDIDHPPVASCFLGYRREQVRHPLDGFGVLVPEIEKRSVLGILFSSSLFPGRAPDGHVALTVMAGGVRQPEIARLAPDALLARIGRDLHELLGVSGSPVFQRHTFWPRAIPQYNLGYGRHLEAIAEAERAFPGLFVGGQVRDGISVPACLAAGEKLAGRVPG